ncbi:MAG TPA: (Na+)-NQR maturation NqrM [Pseudomonadales bacterium]|jgi:hypothetical protein
MNLLGVLAFVLPAMLLFFGLMAVGVMMGRKPISGSCGGMGAQMGDAGCPLCGGDVQKCESIEGGKQKESNSYDAFRDAD